MLRKVIDNFDIDTDGWFDSFAIPEGNNDPGVYHLTKPSQDVWSLWVKNPTAFKFVGPDEYYSHSFYCVARRMWVTLQDYHNYTKYKQLTPKPDAQVLTDMLDNVRREGYFTAEHYAEQGLPKRQADEHDWVYLPNTFINPKTIEAINDHYLLADGITGLGLETLEAMRQVIPPLGNRGLDIFLTYADKRPLTIPNTKPAMRTADAVIASCALDIWWALQTRDIRNHILSVWPGWSDIFTAQDAILLPTAESMQSFVFKKSPYRSLLRRFCMTLAWNLNPHATRIKFPSHTENAYKFAVTKWPTVIAQPNNDGHLLTAIYSFVTELSALLAHEEQVPEKQTPLSGSNTTGLDGKPTKFKTGMRASRHNGGAVQVAPRTLSPKDDHNSNPIVPGVIVPPRNWQAFMSSPDKGMAGIIEEYRQYAKDSHKFQAQHRKAIADQISASAWFVPNPPPLEHGNLDGQLDEGNLLRYAAFSDPNIFSIRPESGAGQIAVGILVDASGSMHHFEEALGTTNMQAALCFVGALRDGLSRNPNVKVEAFAYDSRYINEDLSKSGTAWHAPSKANHIDLPSARSVSACVLRRLDTDDDLLYTQAIGGTPTSPALLTLDQHLTANYPEAQRIILILTDGEPGAGVEHPFIEPGENDSRYFRDNEEEVRKVVSAISTPVFCVGIGVNGSTLQSQYNVGHWFSVDTPLGAVQVACDLVRGIGQSLNC